MIKKIKCAICDKKGPIESFIWYSMGWICLICAYEIIEGRSDDKV